MKKFCFFLTGLIFLITFDIQSMSINDLEKQVVQERMSEIIRERERYLHNANYAITIFLVSITANIFISAFTQANKNNIFYMGTNAVWMGSLGATLYNGANAVMLDQEIEKYKKWNTKNK